MSSLHGVYKLGKWLHELMDEGWAKCLGVAGGQFRCLLWRLGGYQ